MSQSTIIIQCRSLLLYNGSVHWNIVALNFLAFAVQWLTVHCTFLSLNFLALGSLHFFIVRQFMIDKRKQIVSELNMNGTVTALNHNRILHPYQSTILGAHVVHVKFPLSISEDSMLA